MAQAYLEAGQREQALQALAFTERLTTFTVGMVPIAKAIADLLAAEQQKTAALERAYLPDGLLLARTVGDLDLQQAWARRLTALGKETTE